jgi:hypothetical protein
MTNIIKIEATTKPPLVVEYKDNTYEISSSVPVTFFEHINSISKISGKDSSDLEEEMGMAIAQMFLSTIIPEDLKKVLDVKDLGKLVEAWSTYVNLGEESASTK